MTFIFIGLAAIAGIVTNGTALFPVAVVNAIVSLWGNGVLANFRDDPQRAPNAAASASMLSTLVAVILIVAGLIIS